MHVIKGVIEAETGAIEHYNRIIEVTDGVDWVTQDMVIAILHDEEGHRRLFEGYPARVRGRGPGLARRPQNPPRRGWPRTCPVALAIRRDEDRALAGRVGLLAVLRRRPCPSASSRSVDAQRHDERRSARSSTNVAPNA